jgi:hypothetical protein
MSAKTQYILDAIKAEGKYTNVPVLKHGQKIMVTAAMALDQLMKQPNTRHPFFKDITPYVAHTIIIPVEATITEEVIVEPEVEAAEEQPTIKKKKKQTEESDES